MTKLSRTNTRGECRGREVCRFYTKFYDTQWLDLTTRDIVVAEGQYTQCMTLKYPPGGSHLTYSPLRPPRWGKWVKTSNFEQWRSICKWAGTIHTKFKEYEFTRTKNPVKGGPNKEEWEGERIRILVNCNRFSHKGTSSQTIIKKRKTSLLKNSELVQLGMGPRGSILKSKF